MRSFLTLVTKDCLILSSLNRNALILVTNSLSGFFMTVSSLFRHKKMSVLREKAKYFQDSLPFPTHVKIEFVTPVLTNQKTYFEFVARITPEKTEFPLKL